MKLINRNIYALYRGDEFITNGNIQEIADNIGVSRRTVQFYLSPAYAKRPGKVHLVLLEVQGNGSRSLDERWKKKHREVEEMEVQE